MRGRHKTKELYIEDVFEKGILNRVGYRINLSHVIVGLKREIRILEKHKKCWDDDIDTVKRDTDRILEFEFAIKILAECDLNPKLLED